MYTLKARIRTSTDVHDGYVGFRNPFQRPVSETRFGPPADVSPAAGAAPPREDRTYYVFAGFWAPGQDAWIQVDDVRVEAPCHDVVLNPV